MKHFFFMENSQDGIATEDGEEAMDYIIEEGDEYSLKNLIKYKERQSIPIDLAPEDENLESRM